MEQKLQEFIIAHADSDPSELLLKKHKFDGIDMEAAVRCIQGRKKIANKLPDWLRFTDLVFPASVSLEQSSSQATALYKQRFVTEDYRVADLTGGFGADSCYFSMKARSVDYFERNTELADCARENFRIMGLGNISVHNCEVNAELLSAMPSDGYDLVYLDPARRGKAGQRVFSVTDCEPDVSLLKDELLRIAPRILVKVSPMADISALYTMFQEMSECHVLSLHNECKEVLMLLVRDDLKNTGEPVIIAYEIEAGVEFGFVLSEEKETVAEIACRSEIGGYIYEPYTCLTKAGAFKLPTQRMNVKKIAVDTHLYISDELLGGFPGRARKIEAVYDLNKEFMRNFSKKVPECSVTVKNLKMTSEDLFKRLGTKESSFRRLFAVTASDGSKIAILTNSSLQ